MIQSNVKYNRKSIISAMDEVAKFINTNGHTLISHSLYKYTYSEGFDDDCVGYCISFFYEDNK